ncbi:response regulator [Ramlibacter terrae]|uniref:Response regulator n=1 Tax=Ramlibacter terrae TaxID=2732511 RepID=A0ABX6P3S3_9BURK|nr:response regulator [Ramlibacter terrae]
MATRDPSSNPSGGMYELDTEIVSTQPTVFAPGEDKLSEHELRALSPQEMIWRHRSVSGLSEALIMMVDDELLNIEMTQAFLSEAGYKHFVETQDPEQALPMMRKQLPGVLLLDLSMPKVSGLDILSMMRDDPALRHVPVIVLTSSIDPRSSSRRCRSAPWTSCRSRWTRASWACASATRWRPTPTATSWATTTA